jgi:nitrate/nitrite-specific signal transduction histidine kinase
VSDSHERLRDRIDDVTEELSRHSQVVLFTAVAVVVVLPLLEVLMVVVVLRRAGNAVVHPLTDISDALERLRAGESDVRAEVHGLEEIRHIATALNLLMDENARQ